MASWRNVLNPSLAAAAVAAAKDVAFRLQDPELLQRAINNIRQQTQTSVYDTDPAASCYAGHAGAALLFSELDRRFPTEGWDVAGHHCMQVAVCSVKRSSWSPRRLGLGALSGLLFVTWSLSHGETRYLRTLTALEQQALPAIRTVAENVIADQVHGCTESLYDHISGLTGMGVHLLCRRHVPAVTETLEAVLQALIYLAEETDGIPHWYIPSYLSDPGWLSKFPHGHLNCGLAHGIPGPLALLSLAKSSGIHVPSLDMTIRRIADWVVAHHRADTWGIDWPNASPPGDAPVESGTTRTAWCYGIPGVARALWLAGKAVDCTTYRDVALLGMRSVYRRSVEARRLDPSGFCHGIAGLLQITLRFAAETGDTCFIEPVNTLCEQMLANYEPETLLGYRARRIGGDLLDDPGLLNGAAGNALVLLAASTPHEPTWDRFFLLS
ncbi:hypothetical protein EPA93_15460 [Ktedonosporobacter rubrisoli]|uniref:Lanthionine synthetase n=1 Tax=Ktedonosporobacter rubrisoli TaxID=2509675 RepID=A0A4P6JQB1_KTERU|nr:lanthionine synthetase C family protein [Ktedonosporobacter rubrisoli]QBD77312.1 hypothetical protein EPA93_15460 [Ktedonosporobacter rubrisoli]